MVEGRRGSAAEEEVTQQREASQQEVRSKRLRPLDALQVLPLRVTHWFHSCQQQNNVENIFFFTSGSWN